MTDTANTRTDAEQRIEPPSQSELQALLADASDDIRSEADAPPNVTWKNTWSNAPSYRNVGDKTPIGILRSGKNYFYYQRNTNVRVTVKDGPSTYTNTWWALTDDDKGNTNVWVSVVYIKGGRDNEPIPGLPQK